MRIKKIIAIIFIFSYFIIHSQTEKFNILNFGIIEISSDSYLDLASWELQLITKDTSYSLFENSSTVDSFCFFNIIEKIKFIDTLTSDVEITIKKNGKSVFKTKKVFEFNPKTNFALTYNKEKINRNIVRGNIIDSYSVISDSLKYSLVRTKNKEKYNYWYIFRDSNLINIHSEKIDDKCEFISEIVLTDLDNDKNPEFNFFLKKENQTKLIHINLLKKIIGYKEGQKIKLPFQLKKKSMLEYRGFFYYYLNKISE